MCLVVWHHLSSGIMKNFPIIHYKSNIQQECMGLERDKWKKATLLRFASCHPGAELQKGQPCFIHHPYQNKSNHIKSLPIWPLPEVLHYWRAVDIQHIFLLLLQSMQVARQLVLLVGEHQEHQCCVQTAHVFLQSAHSHSDASICPGLATQDRLRHSGLWWQGVTCKIIKWVSLKHAELKTNYTNGSFEV